MKKIHQFNFHRQPEFYNGKLYITPVIDSYNITNGWKKLTVKVTDWELMILVETG